MSASNFVKRIAIWALLGSILLCAAIPGIAFSEERDMRYLLPGETVSNTQNTSSAGERDASFLQPGEAAALNLNASNERTRDKTFLLSSEVAALNLNTSNEGARDKTFLLPGEVSGSPQSSASTGFRRTGSAKIGNCREWVNVRNDPSTRNKPIGRATKGAVINILNWSNDGVWAYVKLNDNRMGWIHGQFFLY